MRTTPGKESRTTKQHRLPYPENEKLRVRDETPATRRKRPNHPRKEKIRSSSAADESARKQENGAARCKSSLTQKAGKPSGVWESDGHEVPGRHPVKELEHEKGGSISFLP